MNGQQYSRSEIPFVYHTAETVASLSPASGATAGETLVRVLGADLQPFKERLCRFGGQETEATFVSSDEVRCLSQPSVLAGAASTVQLNFSSAAELDGVAAAERGEPGRAGPPRAHAGRLREPPGRRRPRRVVGRPAPAAGAPAVPRARAGLLTYVFPYRVPSAAARGRVGLIFLRAT